MVAEIEPSKDMQEDSRQLQAPSWGFLPPPGWITPLVMNLHGCGRGGNNPKAGWGLSRVLPNKLRGKDLKICFRIFLWWSRERNEDCRGLQRKKNESLAISSKNYCREPRGSAIVFRCRDIWSCEFEG